MVYFGRDLVRGSRLCGLSNGRDFVRGFGIV